MQEPIFFFEDDPFLCGFVLVQCKVIDLLLLLLLVKSYAGVAWWYDQLFDTGEGLSRLLARRCSGVCERCFNIAVWAI